MNTLTATELAGMSLREKVGQLFVVRPESLDPSIHWEKNADLVDYSLQEVNERMRAVNAAYPVGGVVLFGHNLRDEDQLTRFLQELRGLNGEPLLYADEEGGRVSRFARIPAFDMEKFESMAAVGQAADPLASAYHCGHSIGSFLKRFGFEIDFAPVADVNTNPGNTVISDRAFSSDPEVVAGMVRSYLEGMRKAGMIGCVKHFPGHGDALHDTHLGYSESMKTWEEMLRCEMVPFRAAIDWGCRFVMTAHISAPAVTGSRIPATLSGIMLTDKLRNELGYRHLIVTDAMEMGAISQYYPDADATVESILAGVDLVVCPKDFTGSFEAVLAAVERGTIREDRLDESVGRVLALRRELRGSSGS